jgi:hypothetical protein
MSTWAKGIKQFGSEIRTNGTAIVRKAVLACFQGVITRSPVDKGTFRLNWRAQVGSVDTTTDETVTQNTALGAPPNGEEMANVQAAVQQAELGDTVYISNDLPYAQRLEEGWSPQNSQMMRKTVDEVAAKARALANTTAQGSYQL